MYKIIVSRSTLQNNLTIQFVSAKKSLETPKIYELWLLLGRWALAPVVSELSKKLYIEAYIRWMSEHI